MATFFDPLMAGARRPDLQAMRLMLAGCLALVSALAWGAACPAPQVADLPSWSSGASQQLAWAPVPGATGYALWLQWRVPEAQVLLTLEHEGEQTAFTLAASPAPARLLSLQIELVSLCGPGQRSAPRVLRQFQSPPPGPLGLP